MSSDATIRCLVADDHPAVLRAVCAFLREQGVEIVGTAADGREALAVIERDGPPTALLDIRMPHLTGVEVARAARAARCPTAIVLYTGFGDQGLLADAVDAGVRGFVLKEAPLPDVLRAIQTVASGAHYVDPVLAGALAATSPRQELSPREREVLRLLADGLTNQEIGGALFLSPETVRMHVKRAMKRLGARTRTQAVAVALRESLIG